MRKSMRRGLNIQGYVSPVLVAGVHEQLVARGLLVRTNSYSEIIRVSLEIALGVLTSKQQPEVVSTITSGSSALDYLRAHGLSVAQMSDKTRQRALHDELAEEYRHFEFPPLSADVPLVPEPDVEEYLKKIMSVKTYERKED